MFAWVGYDGGEVRKVIFVSNLNIVLLVLVFVRMHYDAISEHFLNKILY